MKFNTCSTASVTGLQPILAHLILMAVFSFFLLGKMAVVWAFVPEDHRWERMTFEIKDVTISEAISEASQLSGYEIVINGQVNESRFTLRFVDASLEDVLRRILNRLNYSVIWDETMKRVVVSIVDQVMDDDRVTSSLRSDPPAETIHQQEVFTERVMREWGEQEIVTTIQEKTSSYDDEPSYRMTSETNTKTHP